MKSPRPSASPARSQTPHDAAPAAAPARGPLSSGDTRGPTVRTQQARAPVLTADPDRQVSCANEVEQTAGSASQNAELRRLLNTSVYPRLLVADACVLAASMPRDRGRCLNGPTSHSRPQKRTYEQAIPGPDDDRRRAAFQAEANSPIDNKVFL